MSKTLPPSSPDDPTLSADYASVADETDILDQTEKELEDNDDDEEKEGDGGKGGKKPYNPKDYKVVLDRALLDFVKDDKLDPLQALLELLRKLKLAAPSEIIRGASTFGPEHPDLTLRELGLLTARLTPENVADPHLLRKLDAAQRELRKRENIPHPDDNMTDTSGRGGSVAADIAGLADTTLSDKEKSSEKKHARHDVDEEMEDDRDYHGEPEQEYDLGYDTSELMSPKPAMDMSDIVGLFDDDLLFDNKDDAFDTRFAAADKEIILDTLRELFNYVAPVTEAPVERVALKSELHFDRFDPSQTLDM